MELTGRATRGSLAAGGAVKVGGAVGAGEAGPEFPGTSTMLEHEGHRIFLPATLSGTFKVLLHCVQVTSIKAPTGWRNVRRLTGD